MKLLVLDGNSIINRAFYGIRLLTTKSGHFTNGIYGFLNILLKLIEQEHPDAVTVAFDLRAPTFRHKMYDGYKAGRKGMPPELAEQMPQLKDILALMGYKIIECEGYEADDIIGTLAAASGRDRCVIATGDRDSLQLISDSTSVLLTATKAGHPEIIHCDTDAVAEKYGGLTPHQLIDVKALMGDTSDNIPGVAGVGEKTAVSLIASFGSLDGVYKNIDSPDIKPGVRQKLLNDRDNAYLSRTLGTICCEAPIDTDYSHYVRGEFDRPALTAKLAELELFKLIERMDLSDVNIPLPTSDEAPTQNFDIVQSIGTSGAVTLWYDEQGAALCGGNEVAVYNDLASAFAAACGRPLRVHDAKKLFHICDADICFDSMLAAYLLNPSASGYDIERLIQEYGVRTPEMDSKPAQMCAALSMLCDKLESEIDKNGQSKLLTEIEIPLSRVLADMELAGFLVDIDAITAYGAELQKRIDSIIGQIYEYVGYEFNLNSPKQLGVALFETLGLPCSKKTKSGYSTGAEVLEGLRYEHPAVEMLLEYRMLSKLKSTYCDGLAKAVSDDGRIHSTFNQTETRTGRISSTEPNLQNIPVRTELGRGLRRFFIAPEGRVLCDADYSQIELRVLAHMSGDKNMIDAFKSGEDIHSITASQVFGLPLESVTPTLRSRAKAVNFGIVYGIGPFSLSKDIGVTFGEAKQYIDSYLNTYSGVREYMERAVSDAKVSGFVETLFGRRRYLPELTASNANLRSFGERVARNAPIQGTAADIIKIAMVNVYNRLRREQLDARLILQVHDELIVEASQQDADRAAVIIEEAMRGACEMAVELSADVHIGRTWLEAKG